MPNPDPGLPPLPAKWAEPDPDAPARLERALDELTGQRSAPGYAASDSPRLHYLCRPCWDVLQPGREPAVALADTGPEMRPRAACCRCGQPHSSGIWQYGLRDEFGCRGEHPDG
jgi:hypothetical protein